MHNPEKETYLNQFRFTGISFFTVNMVSKQTEQCPANPSELKTTGMSEFSFHADSIIK